MLQVNGISLQLEDHGSGRPVLLLHGWPDSSYLWRNQIPLLVANGFRAIAPDLRGLGRSDRPEGVAAYSLQNAVGDLVGILDASGIEAADIHDWGATVAWFTATAHPYRVHKLAHAVAHARRLTDGINERAKARLDWKFEVAFGLLEVLDRLVSTVGAISLGQGY